MHVLASACNMYATFEHELSEGHEQVEDMELVLPVAKLG